MEELEMALINKDKLVQAVNQLMDKILKSLEESELFRSIDPKLTEKWQNGFYIEQLGDAKAMYEADEHTYVDEVVQEILSSLGNKYDAEDLFQARQLVMKKNIDLYKTIIKNISSDYYLSKDTNAKEDAQQEKILALKMANLKKIIDVKEFELIYGLSAEAQKGFRGRLNDPIPYIQKKFRSKVQYIKCDVEEWFKDKKR